MPRLPIPSDTGAFPEETRAAVRHILQTRKSLPCDPQLLDRLAVSG
jgi:hypothetical protein